MRSDLYTKIILTVIAACLLALSVRSFQEPAKAFAQTPSRVIIAGIENQSAQLKYGLPIYIYASNPQQPVPVNVAQMAGGAARSLPVTLVGTAGSASVPVRLTGAGDNGTSAVPVNVVQIAGNKIEDGGIPVINKK